MTQQKQLWGGRFTGETDAEFAHFNRSFGFDRRLFTADIEASRAHANGLLRAGVLTLAEAHQISEALSEIRRQHEARGENYFDELQNIEDVHSFLEARLIEMLGELGTRLHTGRSRNDQVATAMRLWMRGAIDDLVDNARRLQASLVDSAERNFAIVLPGYTHLQRAQPVLWAHWCLAYVEMLERDIERFGDARRRTNVLPLGCGALAGTSYAVDRTALAQDLGFADASRNSLDAVSDRDFALDFTHACSLAMMHLSRFAEDLILYASSEFGFVELSDAVATGSSLMPQKKNPDALELVRGKAGRVFGHHTALLTLMKGLPLAYNKDLQEDKEAVFDVFDTTHVSLRVAAIVMANVSLNQENLARAVRGGYMNATELADYLVGRGVAFRTAHDAVGRAVLYAIKRKCELHELSLTELKRFAPEIEANIFDALSLRATLNSKSQIGGTSPARVREALDEARERLNESKT